MIDLPALKALCEAAKDEPYKFQGQLITALPELMAEVERLRQQVDKETIGPGSDVHHEDVLGVLNHGRLPG